MEKSEHYVGDVLFYFHERPMEHSLYEVLEARMEEAFPDTTVKVQKSQISFYARHLFAAVSLPVRRKKGWPARCLLVTFGLSHRVDHPRIAVAVEPYPNRWTHHVVVSAPEEIDRQLMDWLREAHDFALVK